jgi:uncharacterized protein (DUF2237 family)
VKTPLNVSGEILEMCCGLPKAGFFRTGKCETGPQDGATHVVCAQVTEEFLDFTKLRGNDLSTARAELGFPDLKPGDRWCLCALRWREALVAAVAPPVILAASHESALRYVTIKDLSRHALDGRRQGR